MRRTATSRIFICLALVSSLAAVPAATFGADIPQTEKPVQGMKGISKPSDDRTISYVHPGLIAEVLVKEGVTVKEGQLIARQEDSVEQAALKVAKSEADNITEPKVERAVRKKDEEDSKMIESVPGTSLFEKRDAALKVTIDDARIEMADQKVDKAKLQFDQTSAECNRLKVTSPMEGIIEKIFLKAGESADGGSMKAFRIVQIDPMYVEVQVATVQARKLKKEDPATITFPDENVKPLHGKVLLKSSVADSASETIMVRIEVANPNKVEPGENVQVVFDNAAVAAKPK